MPRRQYAVIAATVLWLPAACTPNVQPLVAQFGGAVTTTAAAEHALFDAVDARKADRITSCVLASNSIAIGVDNRITPLESNCDVANSTALPANVRNAIEQVLQTLADYGDAQAALAGDNAAATFATNFDRFGQSVRAFDAGVLTPPGAPGSLSQDQVNAVGEAVNYIAKLIIDRQIANNVKTAADQVKTQISTIATTLKQVNGYWTAQLPAQNSASVRGDVIDLWRKANVADRQALMAAWARASAPLTATAANQALDDMVAANNRIATAGPTASMAEIRAAITAAQKALIAYRTLAGK